MTQRDYNRVNELLDFHAGVEDCTNYKVEDDFELENGVYALFRATLEVETKVVNSHSSYDPDLYTRTITYTKFELFMVFENGEEIPLEYDQNKIRLTWIEK